MTRLENTAESGLADGTILTLGNSDDGSAGSQFASVTGAAGTIGTDNTISFSTTSPIRGSLSLRHSVFSTDTSSCYHRLGVATAVSGTASLRWYGKFAALPSGGNPKVVRVLNGSGVQCFALAFTTGGAIEIRNASNTLLATTTAAFAVGDVFRIEWWLTPGTTTSTGRIGFAVYAGHSTTPLDTYSATSANLGTVQTIRDLEIGKSGAPNADYDFYVDDIVFDDGIGETFVGPAVTQAEGAVQFDATSTTDLAPLAQQSAAVQADATSAVSFAPLAQPRGSVAAAGTSAASFSPSSSASVRADAVSVVSFAPVVNGPAAFSVAATSAVSFAPLAQKRAAVTAAATSAASFSPLAQLRAAFAASATSAVALAALAQPRATFTTTAGSTVSFAPTIPPKGARVYYRGSLIERAYYQGEEVTIR